MNSSFLNTMDELIGGVYELLPEDEYEWKIVERNIRYVEALDASKVELTLEVVNDEDGFNGRKLWTEGWLDGTFNGKGGVTSRCVFETFKLVKALIAANPEAAYLSEFPHFDAAAFKEDQSSLAIPKDDLTGEPDYNQWEAYLDTIIADELTFRATVKHVAKRVKVEGEFDENGKQVYVDSKADKRAVIDKYLWN